MNGFEYELIDPFLLDQSFGFLNDVTGGKVTESYRGDYRATASIDIDGEFPDARYLIRIWRVEEGESEQVRTMLGTFTQGKPSIRYINGRKIGSIPLYSSMYRLGLDLVAYPRTYAAGTEIIPLFESIVKESGSTPWVHPGFISGAMFGSETVWEGGETTLSMCHKCANALGAMVGVDSLGRITLEPYQPPAYLSDSFAINSYSADIVCEGVGITTADWCNYAVVTATVDEVEYVGTATVDVNNPLHPKRIGYWKADYSTMSDPPASDVQAVVELAAKTKLAELSNAPNIYSAEMLYCNITCGEVGTFWYKDSPDDDGLFVRALVTQREIDLTPAMRMRVTFEEV